MGKVTMIRGAMNNWRQTWQLLVLMRWSRHYTDDQTYGTEII
jgi:hypothetical protein